MDRSITEVSPPVMGLVVHVPTERDEDAEPLFVPASTQRRWSGGLAVFDGLGGAGSVIVETPEEARTSAYCASRIAREVVEAYLASPSFHAESVDAIKDDLESLLTGAFRQGALELPSHPTGLITKLIKRLPTTLVCVLFSQPDPDAAIVSALALWAGDSRAYTLTPAAGLQQLSRDDLVSGGDALENLEHDSPMSNYVNADTPFAISANEITVKAPAILLAATDGCFAPLATPAHFEELLLRTLIRSDSCCGWKQELEARLQEAADDDCSLALATVGWDDFSSMRQAFETRLLSVTDRYIRSVEGTGDIKTDREARKRVWDQYRTSYEALMPPGQEGEK